MTPKQSNSMIRSIFGDYVATTAFVPDDLGEVEVVGKNGRLHLFNENVVSMVVYGVSKRKLRSTLEEMDLISQEDVDAYVKDSDEFVVKFAPTESNIIVARTLAGIRKRKKISAATRERLVNQIKKG